MEPVYEQEWHWILCFTAELGWRDFFMKILFGKHHGSTTGRLLCEDPAYVDWLLQQEPTKEHFRLVQKSLRSLIVDFDRRRIVQHCHNTDCGARARRCAVDKNWPCPTWWCDDCDPYKLGAYFDRPIMIRTFAQAAAYTRRFDFRQPMALKILVEKMALAKGMPTWAIEDD